MTDVGLVLVVILILALIWRGPKTLPKLGEAFGRGVKEARREAAEARDDLRRHTDGDPTADPQAPPDDRPTPGT
ncbi:MAG TPA: twin-arginine translocase TatA/TatE family subunit [Candidatus Limnocylindrales bacterium]|nr:twin-arginine translocase TatA/TatE family subunit [Candidatus Limnocylindrales bacterium]